MNTVLSLLLMIVNTSLEKNTNYRIALEIIKLSMFSNELTINEIAELSNTSIFSVNKFLKVLGFKNFNEFKFALITTIETRQKQLLFHLENTTEESILANIKNLSVSIFDQNKFIKAVEKLNSFVHQSDKITILGACFPEALTLHYQEDMLMMGKFLYSRPLIYPLAFPKLDESELILIITLTGRIYEFYKILFDQLCNDHNNIVLISGYENYPKYSSIQEIINIPVNDDNEVGNAWILEILRFIKYKYYKKYGGYNGVCV